MSATEEAVGQYKCWQCPNEEGTCKDIGVYIEWDTNTTRKCPCGQWRNHPTLVRFYEGDDAANRLENAKGESKKTTTRQRAQTFESFISSSQALTTARNRVRRYAEGFVPDQTDGILLMGPTGVGKSHLATALLLHLLQRGFMASMINVPAKLAEMKLSGFDNDMGNQLLATVEAADLLILDDIGAENPGGWASETLLMILEKRFHVGKATGFTMNILPSEARARLGDRVYSRIHEMAPTENRLIFTPDTKDWRMR